MLSCVYSEFAHVRSAAESALAKLYSKIVILDLQKSIFFRPAGAVQRGSVCTLSLIEPVQCVSERSPPGRLRFDVGDKMKTWGVGGGGKK